MQKADPEHISVQIAVKVKDERLDRRFGSVLKSRANADVCDRVQEISFIQRNARHVNTMFRQKLVVALQIQCWDGQPSAAPGAGVLNLLLGAERLIPRVAGAGYNALQNSMFIALIFVALKFLLRRNWLVALALAGVLVVVADQGRAITSGFGIEAIMLICYAIVALAVLFKLGLLAMTAVFFVTSLIGSVPMPAHFSGWAATPAVWTLILLVGLACAAFYAARAGQPLFGRMFEQFSPSRT